MTTIETILTSISHSPGATELRKALNDAYRLGFDAKTVKLERLLDACLANDQDAIAVALKELVNDVPE